MSLYRVQNWNLCIFVCVCVNLVAMANPFAPLKFLLAYLNSPTQKPYCTCKHCLYILYRTEICAILVYFLPNFGFHGNFLGSLENSGSIIWIQQLCIPYHTFEKLFNFFAQNWNLCYFGLFSSKFGCHGNCLASVEISDSIFEFADPENVTIRVEKSLIFLCRTEICAFFVYFCPNLVAMATPLAPLKFRIAYLNSPTPKILLLVWKSPRFFCAELKSVQFLLIFV